MAKRFFSGLLFLMVLLTSCQPTTVGVGPWVKKIHSEEFSRLVINYSKFLKEEYGIELEDSWIAYNDDVKRICLKYSSQRLLTVYEARLLMVELVEGFLYRLNNHSLISYELEHYPFTADDMDVQINFESYYGLYVDPLYIGLTWLQCGCVHFYAFDRKDLLVDWDHHRFEPYFKSRELALLKKEADIPFTDKLIRPKKPSEYIFDRYEPWRP